MEYALAYEEVRIAVGRKVLVDGLTLRIPARGVFGIVGANGAGKSTLVLAALGLRRAQAGRIVVLGRPLAAWRPRELALRVGYVPQQLESYWDLTVAELLHLAPAAPSADLVAECELQALLHRRFNTLSGGERARAAVARALAHRPALLLADEPAAHLDVPHQHHLMRLLRACARDTAVVIVVHDLHLAERYCDRVALVAHGALARVGTPEEVLEDASLGEAYGQPIARIVSGGHAFFTLGPDRPDTH